MATFRYWRINVTATNSGPVGISEVQWRTVAGGAKSAPTTITATTTFAGFPASNVNDGSTATFWASNGSVPQALVFDFGADITFAELAIAPRPDGSATTQAPFTLTIDGSEDNVSWTNVATFGAVSGWAANTFQIFDLTAWAKDGIAKAGMVGVMRLPDGNIIPKAGMVGVMRMPPGHLMTKAGMVAVMRQKTLVDSLRRRQGMVPIF